MVSMLMRSALREIRQSLGRFLAILAIVALGVAFFSGLRMSQPSMMATGVKYLTQYRFYDIRMMSSLGFTQEDVDYFAAQEDVETARGSVYTEFLWQKAPEDAVVLMAHSLTEGINQPELTAGRLPERGNECLGDDDYFTAEDLGRTIRVSTLNDEDTRDLFAYEEYTLVGLVSSPMYLNFERGTAGIGSGSIAAYVLLPEEAFEFEAYYEIYLRLRDMGAPYSQEYKDRLDLLKPQVERWLEGRADLRYTTLYNDAMDEIRDGEQELADGWEEYRTERADAEQELADAHQELLDGEQEYADGVADYEQGKLDYADGLKKYQDGLKEVADAKQELADARQELADGRAELEEGRQELLDGEKELADGKQELADGKAELEEAKQKLADGKQELADGRQELADAKQEVADGWKELEDGKAELQRAKRKLNSAKKQLAAAKAELEAGEAGLVQLETLYQGAAEIGAMLAPYTGAAMLPEQLIPLLKSNTVPMLNAAVDGALRGQGSSLEEFLAGWDAAEASAGAPLTRAYLDQTAAMLETGRAEYDRGYSQYRSGLRAYNDGMDELEEAEQKLLDAEQEIADGEQELAEAEQEIADGEQEIADAEQEIADAEQEIADAEQELADGWAELADGEQELADAEQKIADGEQDLAEAEQELADAERELADAKKDLEKAPQEFSDARKELDDGWQEYEDGKKEAEQEFADAEEELADGEQEIADAYVELADLKQPDTYTLTRSENVGYASFDNDTAIIAAVSVAFPAFFFLVAALVCMTTMKRMVDEQRTQIGVLKAIGYSRRQIIGKYLLYSGSAAITGAVLGYIVGSRGLPLIIWEIYGIMYSFAPLETVFDPALAAVSLGAALLCSMGATWLSCRLELENPAAQLIRPKAPKAGKRIFLERITPVWKRLSFLRKVSFRNILRYKSRLAMMILGIGGCTALLIVGFGIRDSIGDLAIDQFEEITLYDYAVTFQNPKTREEADAFLTEQGWQTDAGLLVHSGSTDVVSGDMSKSVYLVVSAEGTLGDFIRLHSSGREIAYPKAGEVVLNNGLAEKLGLTVGSPMQLRDKKLGSIDVTVSDICDNYIFDYVYVASETYEQQLGAAPEFKTLFVHARPGADPYEENVSLADGEDISSVTVNAASRDRVTGMLSRLNIVVVVVVAFAAALAFVVLYNLTNINITERIREIATVKVLGFYQNEVAAYVFRENVILSALGGFAGLFMGKALHAFIMAQIQVEGMFFPQIIEVRSYAVSYLLTMVFSFVISCCMRPKLKKIDMAESLKSIE